MQLLLGIGLTPRSSALPASVLPLGLCRTCFSAQEGPEEGETTDSDLQLPTGQKARPGLVSLYLPGLL